MTEELINLPYAKRDALEVLEELKVKVRALTGNQWTDFRDTDPGYALLKAAVALFDFNAFYVDRQASEGFLTLAKYRESVIRQAKSLNYIPRSLAPATVEVLLTFPAFGGEVVIPADSLWDIDGKTFMCESVISIPAAQTSIQITLVQGTRYTAQYTAPGTNWYRVTIPNDIGNPKVEVDDVEWSAIDSFIDVIESTSYRIYEDVGGKSILFGANVGTDRPSEGAVIDITGIKTLGAAGNTVISELPCYPVSTITDGASNDITNSFSGITLSAALGGVDNESTASIRANAPKFYGTQGRAVTETDYEVITLAQPGVEEALVVGGERIGRYGVVLIIVRGANPYTVSPDLIASIKEALTPLKMVTIELDVRAPVVVEETITATVGLDNAVYATHSEGLNIANNAIVEYFGNLQIGEAQYGSELECAVLEKGGFRYFDFTTMITTFATSVAGAISIPLPLDYDLTNSVLRNANGDVLWSGDGASKVVDDSFIHAVQGLADQKVSLEYIPADGKNVITSVYQLAVLKSAVLTTKMVA